MATAGTLPPVSALLPSILPELGLPGLAEAAIERIPDRVVDELLPTREVLERSVEQLDAEEVLASIDQPNDVEDDLRNAIRDGAIDTARSRLPGL